MIASARTSAVAWLAAGMITLAMLVTAPAAALASDDASVAPLPPVAAADVTDAKVGETDTVPTDTVDKSVAGATGSDEAGDASSVSGTSGDAQGEGASAADDTDDVAAADPTTPTGESAAAQNPAKDTDAADATTADATTADATTADAVATEPKTVTEIDVAPKTDAAATGKQSAKAAPVPTTSAPSAVSTQAGTAPAGRVMFRLYNPNSGEHFYTASTSERDGVRAAGWSYEGIGWIAPLDGAPVYRMYNPNAGDHHYTASSAERSALVNAGWIYEGIGWYSGGSHSVLRQYNPNALAGSHNYTLSSSENDTLARAGWNAEGIGWYAIAVNSIPKGGFWMINKAIASDALVWVAANGYMAKGRLVTPQEGAGRLAYATTTGAVVRGTHAVNENTVYIANTSNGALFTSQWVTGNFGNGNRRYYVKADHTCAVGPFADGESDYIGLKSVGYVGTGEFTYGDAVKDANAFKHADGNGALLRTVKATYESVSGKGTTAPMTTKSLGAGGKSYIFLPSGAPVDTLRSVKLGAVQRGADAHIWIAPYGASSGFEELDPNASIDVLARATKSGNLWLLNYKVSATSSIQTLAFMFSSTVPSLFLTSVEAKYDREWLEDVKADPWHVYRSVQVTALMVDPDGTVTYTTGDKAATLKGRGNSSWSFQTGGKKPYQIKFDKKVDLLNTGDATKKAKKWVLLANVNDVSLVRNSLAYNLGLELGMIGTQSKPIDLWYDGEYRGNYLLCEKIEIGEGRINITDLQKAIEKAIEKAGREDLVDELDRRTENSANFKTDKNRYGYTYRYLDGLDEMLSDLGITVDYSGGWLMEVDLAYFRQEKYYFDSSWGQVVIKEPEFVSRQMMKYISEWFEASIKNLQAGKYSAGSGNHSTALFDRESLAKTVLVNEFFKNPDCFASSTYFFKDANGKDATIYAMPLWDFDSSMGIRSVHPNKALSSYHSFSMPTLAARMSSCPVVLNRAQSIWTESMSKLVHNVLLGGINAVGPKGYLHSLTYYLDQIKTSAAMDVITWGFYVFENVGTPFPTYDANTAYLRSWLTMRTAYFDDNIRMWTTDRCDYYIAEWDGFDYGLVFDAAYYLKMNPDVAAAMPNGSIDYRGALQHFVTCGINEVGRIGKTARNFNVKAYMDRYPDLRAAFGNNLALYYKHYCESGYRENRICV